MKVKTKRKDIIDLVPSLREVVTEKHLDISKINVAFLINEQNKPYIKDRCQLCLNDGGHFGQWHISSLRKLFRGTKQPLEDISYYPEEYCGIFFAIEKNVLMVSNVIGDLTDDEFVRLYSLLRRCPDGRSEGFMHDVIYQSAALALGLHPLSQDEFEAVFSQLARSARHWRQGYSSRNYIRYLRDNIGAAIAEEGKDIGREILLNKIKQSDYFSEKTIVFSSSKEKMSRVIIDFAKPLLDIAEDAATAEKAISFAIAVWNLSLLPEREQEEMINQLIEAFSSGSKEGGRIARVCIRILVDRKKRYFANNKRFIADFHCSTAEDGFHLNVVSTASPEDTGSLKQERQK